MALINKLTAIADSIRAKTGKEDTLTLDQMPIEIAGIQTGAELNFKVVGGTSAPTSPVENMIWVNTNTEITSWHFRVDEPNVCKATVPDASDPWVLSIPHTLHEGDILNFTIPVAVSSTFEAIRIYDSSGKLYFVRSAAGNAATAWSAGTKVGFVISNTSHIAGDWGSDGGTAHLYKWASYYHKEGTVWITTGKSSTAPFNALKKNNITVYPISAKQYVNGAWVDKTAKIYQSGAWVDWWDGQLYENGNQFTSITGGWGIHDYITNSRPLMAAEHKADQMFF